MKAYGSNLLYFLMVRSDLPQGKPIRMMGVPENEVEEVATDDQIGFTLVARLALATQAKVDEVQ